MKTFKISIMAILLALICALPQKVAVACPAIQLNGYQNCATIGETFCFTIDPSSMACLGDPSNAFLFEFYEKCSSGNNFLAEFSTTNQSGCELVLPFSGLNSGFPNGECVIREYCDVFVLVTLTRNGRKTQTWAQFPLKCICPKM